MKQDSNKKIINEVLYRKISTHKTKMDTSGVNSRFNSSTLGNFKHLQKLFNSYRQVIKLGKGEKIFFKKKNYI